MIGLRKLACSAAIMMALCASAAAHTTYVLPVDFSPDGEQVEVQAAHALTFFTPAVGLASSDFHALRPDGRRIPFQSTAVGNPATTLVANLATDGTYRFTTGEVMGPITTMVAADGSWRALGAGEVVAEGVETTTLQTVTVAESYATKTRPSREPVDVTIGSLAIHPITHPNEVLVSQGLELELLLNGAPFPNMPFVLYAAGEPETDIDRTFVTNEQGRATIMVDAPGTYIVAVRHRGPAPADAGVAVRSYTTSLTFEAVTALPNYPPPPPPEDNRRNRRRNRD